MTEPTVQVPVSLIKRAAHAVLRGGDSVAVHEELRALLSQPTPSAEACIEANRYHEGIEEVLTSWFPEYEGVGTVIEDASNALAARLVDTPAPVVESEFPAKPVDEAVEELRRKAGEHRC